ncbi:MAG: hypothetical protein N2260_08900 [Syntrophobacterales bacterium]|nr:hypothetical protein [Syntrophobacterales bacterium]
MEVRCSLATIFFTIYTFYCGLLYGATGAVINEQVVANAGYDVIVLSDIQRVQLKNGVYDPGTNPLEDENYIYVELERVKFSDLNGDGMKDALVVLYASTGGSAGWINLTGLIAGGKEPIQIDPLFLGDRVLIKEIQIPAPRRVCLKILFHGPEDPSCCPTKRGTKCFDLVNREGKWILEGRH